MDSFLVYDYKATTDYHGENLEASEYEVKNDFNMYLFF